ncbi:MAG: VOC family protein [Ilumatobacter sp.]|uniref:VOC family protein n=1 Tax=Ilumatobacter sp. TaxID=1967498 RepID=UPI003C70695E
MDLPVDGTLFQEAYFVDDLERVAQAWSSSFGAGPFVVAPHHRCDRFDYRGSDTEADVSYAFGYLDDVMIQFIVQHDDAPSIYRDMYPDGPADGAGFHHIGILVSDFEAEFERLEAAGFVCATRLYADGVDAAYFDTRHVTGGFTEIHGTPAHIVATFDRWRESHRRHVPGGPAIVPRN